MDTESLLELKRTAVSAYCETCGAKCCKKGAILLTKKTRELFPQTEIIVEREDGYFTLTLPCPKLEHNRCTIYELRPQICRDYPFFKRGEKVFVSSVCEAIQKNIVPVDDIPNVVLQ